MNKLKKYISGGFETTLLLILLITFVGVMGAAWNYAMNVRATVSGESPTAVVDPTALVEVEKMRTLASLQISDSRSYFVLGSKSLYDKQKQAKEDLSEALANFQKNYSLPQVGEIVKKIETLEAQESDFFAQAVSHREKQTESKIVGQFYQSKTNPLINDLNQAFNQIITLHNAELEKEKLKVASAGQEAQALIPSGMQWLTLALTGIIACLALLVLRLVWVRRRLLKERTRLVEEAKKSILARDEIVAAVAFDFNDSLNEIRDTAESIKSTREPSDAQDKAELIKATVTEIEGIIRDIDDQKKADLGNLTLRLEQLGVADILEDAQTMLQPLAKSRDVGLQVDSVNESVLAFVDRERVMRVLNNLIGNAVKYSRKHTKILVKVRADQQFVNISIADTGPGIPSNQIPTLFDNFWQARKTADQGAGVGLAVVKTIIEAHGGNVKVDSNVGQGSTFTFSLPRRRPAGAQLKKPSASTVRRLARQSPAIENAPTL